MRRDYMHHANGHAGSGSSMKKVQPCKVQPYKVQPCKFLPNLSAPRRSDLLLKRIVRDRDEQRRLPPIRILTSPDSSASLDPTPSSQTEFGDLATTEPSYRQILGPGLFERDSVEVVAQSRREQQDQLLSLLSGDIWRNQQQGANKFARRKTVVLKNHDQRRASAESATPATGNFDQCIALAKKHNVKLQRVKEISDEFQGLDANADGELSFDEFKDAIKKKYNLGSDADEKLERQWKSGAKDGASSVDFEEFFIWRLTSQFNEDFAITDDSDRKLRKLARELGVSYMDIDRMKGIFGQFDQDDNGSIDNAEFKSVVISFSKTRIVATSLESNYSFAGRRQTSTKLACLIWKPSCDGM